MADIPIVKKYDRFDQFFGQELRRITSLTESTGKRSIEMMRGIAPVSDINIPGYEHFRDMFRLQKMPSASLAVSYAIYNDKVVNGYELWKLLEFGTPKMAARKTINPVMDIVGPEYIKQVGGFVTR